MKRREFFKQALVLGSGSVLQPQSRMERRQAGTGQSRVIIATDPLIKNAKAQINTDRLLKMLDTGMQILFDADRVVESWRKIVKPGEVIGLKINCLSGYGSTHLEVVEGIIERLQGAGIKSKDIIVWDRLSKDLEAGGFKIKESPNNVRYIGNDILGFDSNLETFGSAASLVCRTVSKACDAIINIPLLKDHSIAGLTMALKNMFGAIHNPHKYHLNLADPYIADVNRLRPIHLKTRLHICDALEAQYEGGPSFMPQWRWPMNSLLFSTDPVALDYTGWQIIDRKRIEKGMISLQESGREPKYISTAADADHRLGTNNPKKIEVIQV